MVTFGIRKLLLLLTIALVATCLPGLQPTGAIANPVANSTPSKPLTWHKGVSKTGDIYVVTHGNESTTDAIWAYAAHHKAFRKAALRLAKKWKNEVASGGSVAGINVGAGHLKHPAKKLHSLIVHLQRGNKAGPFKVDPDNPNSFPVRGEPGSGQLYWTGMRLILEGYFCGNVGCELTDKWVSRIKIDAGPTVTRITGGNLWFPNSGNFSNIHFRMWGVCRGRVCSAENTGGLPVPTSIDYLRDYGDRHGNVLTVGIVLWIYAAPLGGYIFDTAKTHDAICEDQSQGNMCWFSETAG